MIRILPLIVIALFSSCKNGESLFSNNKSNRPSPPAKATGSTGDVNVIINYSSPRVRERQIWGDLVPYNRIWRTGANEATNLTLSKDVLVNGQSLPRGRYSLFTIPGEEEWTIIFNKDWDLWGSYDYSEKKDVLRITVTPYEMETHKENLTFLVQDEKLTFQWEKLAFDLNITAAGN